MSQFSFWRRSFLQIAAVMLAAAAGTGCTASADTPTSATLATLYSFNPSAVSTQSGSPLIGYTPHSLTAGPNNKFYALTQAGGNSGAGTVLSFNANLGVSRVLYTFPGGTGPDDSVMAGADGSSLYGTLAAGGAPASGAVYSLSADGSRYATLHEFTAPDGSGINTDGTYPLGPLLQAAGSKLYGETLLGGPNGEGVVYAVNPDGSGFAVLHSFGSGADGAYPSGGLIAGPDGGLYGVTECGGAGGTGTVFKIAPDGSGYAVLYQFSASDSQNANPDGAFPLAGLTLGSDGLLYGVTTGGGGSGSGAIFQLRTDGSGFTALYAFTSPDSQGLNGDGAYPSAALVKDASGNLIGTTVSGGSAGQGTLFALSANAAALNFLYSFGSSDGASPVLTVSHSGLIFGTTAGGGTSSLGSVFSVDLNYPSTHVLWTNTSGQMSLWNLDTSTGFFTHTEYGPFSGWSAAGLANGADRKTRVLWNNANGAFAVWTVDAAGNMTSTPAYGPIPGWSAAQVAVGTDNQTRLLLKNVSGAAAVWTLDSAGSLISTPAYGPYGAWTAKAMSVDASNNTHLLFSSPSGQFSLWRLDASSHVTSSPVFGSYAGWSATSIACGADSDTRLLLNNESGAAAVWTLDNGSGGTSTPAYGPILGWSEAGVTVSAVGLTQLLLKNVSGAAAVWTLDSAGSLTSTPAYGPYSGWTAVGVSAAP